MQFEKGKPRPLNAGRKSGTPNRKTKITQEYIQQIAEGFPPEEVIQKIKSIKDPAKQVDILLRLWDFILPRKQRIHVEAESGEEPTQQIMFAGQLIKF